MQAVASSLIKFDPALLEGGCAYMPACLLWPPPLPLYVYPMLRLQVGRGGLFAIDVSGLLGGSVVGQYISCVLSLWYLCSVGDGPEQQISIFC